MSTSDTNFAGSIPQLYDNYLVPLIFGGYAEDMAARVAGLGPSAVLEVAAGTGVVTRALAARLSSDARYVVTDLNQPMLDHAMRKQGADPRLMWQQADGLSLPFPDAAFDVVCCQFGAMFFPDRVRGYGEAKRVLNPDGTLVFSVWDRIEENAFANDVTTALSQYFPADPPLFLRRTPHGYHDAVLIREELERAGFSTIVIEKIDQISRAGTPLDVAIAYCQGTPLRSEIEDRGPDVLSAATEHVAAIIASTYGSGEVAAKIQALVITAKS